MCKSSVGAKFRGMGKDIMGPGLKCIYRGNEGIRLCGMGRDNVGIRFWGIDMGSAGLRMSKKVKNTLILFFDKFHLNIDMF